jgi:hypothetical protein
VRGSRRAALQSHEVSRETRTGIVAAALAVSAMAATIDTDSIGASYEGGVLTLTLAFSEAAKPRKVEVRASGDQTTIEPRRVLAKQGGAPIGFSRDPVSPESRNPGGGQPDGGDPFIRA